MAQAPYMTTEQQVAWLRSNETRTPPKPPHLARVPGLTWVPPGKRFDGSSLRGGNPSGEWCDANGTLLGYGPLGDSVRKANPQPETYYEVNLTREGIKEYLLAMQSDVFNAAMSMSGFASYLSGPQSNQAVQMANRLAGDVPAMKKFLDDCFSVDGVNRLQVKRPF